MNSSKNIQNDGFERNSEEDTKIVYAKIHPGIGIARVGNSPDEYFIGPEYPMAEPQHYGFMRDRTGAIKRQAARFRIYGYNSAGVAVKELTPDDTVEITWTVEVANTKSSWYVFDSAMDLRDDEGKYTAKPAPRRNPDVTGYQRQELEIRPPAKTISGTSSEAVQLDGGTFKSFKSDPPQVVNVNLGELRTDEMGRLLVLGGHGIAESPSGAPLLVYDDEGNEHNFNNSIDWFDDISDGPVSATLRLGKEDIPVTGAWVVVAPPDFAPGIVPFRSLYDMAMHTAIDAGLAPRDETSYTKHVLPLLERLSGLQWLNLGSAQVHGPGGNYPITTSLIHELAKPDSTKRNEVFHKFRSPDDETVEGHEKLKWPQLYGDGYGLDAPSKKGDLLSVAPQTYEHLTTFIQEGFVADLDKNAYPESAEFPAPVYARPLEELPVAEQPAKLDAGPLSYCCADAFHPGCELTWIMRHASLYLEPLRIKPRDPSLPSREYGDSLTPEEAIGENGPLHAQGPGDLTRWMAIPWHGDTARCRSGYDKEFHPYLPTYWPTSVPNEVLTEESYKIYSDSSKTDSERMAAFQRRDVWMRQLFAEFDTPEEIMQAMIRRFDEMGIVQPRQAPPDLIIKRPTIFVEELKPNQKLSPVSSAFAGNIDGSPVDNLMKILNDAGWTEEKYRKMWRLK